MLGQALVVGGKVTQKLDPDKRREAANREGAMMPSKRYDIVTDLSHKEKFYDGTKSIHSLLRTPPNLHNKTRNRRDLVTRPSTGGLQQQPYRDLVMSPSKKQRLTQLRNVYMQILDDDDDALKWPPRRF